MAAAASIIQVIDEEHRSCLLLVGVCLHHELRLPIGEPERDGVVLLAPRLLESQDVAVEGLLARWMPQDETLVSLVAAAWRAALWLASASPDAAESARSALERLLASADAPFAPTLS